MKRIALLLLALAPAASSALAQPAADSAFNPPANNTIFATAVQTDGKAIVGGAFTTMNAQTARFLARVNTDGSLDSTFTPNVNGEIFTVAALGDGSVLVGGGFNSIGGATRQDLARVATNGVADSFNPSPNNYVFCLLPQPDGKILVGGYFTAIGGATRNYIARLNADGTLDTTFNPNANAEVFCMTLQPDGKILVGGLFTTMGGQPALRVARLNANGSLDNTFSASANGTVRAITVQPDGKILVAGAFDFFNNIQHLRLARVDGSGNLDSSFDPVASAEIFSMQLQTDGRIVVGGGFETLGPAPNATVRPRIGRFNAAGSVDAGYNPVGDGSVRALVLQTDGKLLVAGQFTTMGGAARANLARLDASGSATQSLGIMAGTGAAAGTGTVTWSRSGTGPETTYASLETSGDGINFTPAGSGTRVVGGWQFTGVGLPQGATTFIRVRGLLQGGLNNGSTSLAESSASFFSPGTAPTVITQPLSQTVVAGANVTFTVVATGTLPFTYQWRKNGVNIPGATGSSLTLTGVLPGDGGDYSVVVTNSSGSDTSTAATLTVVLNTAPSFTAGPTVTVGQDSGLKTVTGWATAITPGVNAVESTQALNFIVSNNNNALFASQPAISSGGNLTFTPASGALGSAIVTVQLHDNGGTAGGGADTSAAQMFTVNVVAANHAPTLAAIANLTIITNAGLQTVTLTGISPGPASEAAQLLTITATSSNPALIPNPAVSYTQGQTTGTLTFTSALNASGVAIITVVIQDNGGTLFGGVDAVTNQFTVTVVAGPVINQPPADAAFNPGTDNVVFALALQADGKAMIGGQFTTLAGGSRRAIGRVNSDGSFDSTFNANINVGGEIYAAAALGNGSVLVGGGFTSIGGAARLNLARLSTNGVADSFNPGPNNYVFALAVQPNGQFLVGGYFTTIGGQTRNHIARLNADGSLDATFNPDANSEVFCITLQPDGKILVGGLFTTIGGQAALRIARLNADGSLDNTFTASANSTVRAIFVQPDGNILVAGAFDFFNNTQRLRLARVNASGTLEAGFDPVASAEIFSMQLQTDGKIIVGGGFETLGPAPTSTVRPRLGRFNADGSVDSGYNPVADGSVRALLLQPDGKMLVGGQFTTLGGASRQNLGRLVASGAVSQSLAVVPGTGASAGTGTVTWSRSGTGPESAYTFIETSSDGLTYTAGGSGTRVSGGWQFTGVTLPLGQTTFIRTRGNLQGGHNNGSFSFGESLTSFFNPASGPLITSQPVSQTLASGANVTFSVTATGTGALTFQWFKNGVLIPGATSSLLVLTGVTAADAASTPGYTVVVTDTTGSATSNAATLTVLPNTAPVLANLEVPSLIYAAGQPATPVTGTITVTDVDSTTLTGATVQITGNFMGAEDVLAFVNTVNITGSFNPANGLLTLSGTDTLANYRTALRSVTYENTSGSPSQFTRTVTFIANDGGAANNLSSAVTRDISVLPASSNPQVAIATLCPVAPGSTIVVPIWLVGKGTENSVSFTLNFNPAVLTYVGTALGSGAPTAILVTNQNQAATGKVGILIATNFGAVFFAGTREIALVTFTVAASATATITDLTFGDTPVVKQVTGAAANIISATYFSGAVCTTGYSGGLEGDANGSGTLTSADWVQIGRYAGGLDPMPTGAAFQRSDCAPRSTLGDGLITLADWVQAGRYAAGLDPATPTGGPAPPPPPAAGVLMPAQSISRARLLDATGRNVQVVNTTAQAGRGVTVSVQLNAQGNENSIGFSVSFDPAKLTFVSASGPVGATFIVNSQRAGSGSVGVLVALAPGSVMAAGAQEISKLTFTAAAGAPGSAAITFGDSPVAREIVSAQAASLPATFTAGTVTITPAGPAIRAMGSQRAPDNTFGLMIATGDGTAMTPARLAQIEVWVADSLSANPADWTRLPNALVLINGQVMLMDGTGAAAARGRFYKLVEPR